MKFQVITPRGTILDKEVGRVTVPGAKGAFTILKNHAPIISTLVEGNATYLEGQREGSVKVIGGVVHVSDNVIRIIGLCEK